MWQWALENPEAAIALVVFGINAVSVTLHRVSPKVGEVWDSLLPFALSATHRALKRQAPPPAEPSDPSGGAK